MIIAFTLLVLFILTHSFIKGINQETFSRTIELDNQKLQLNGFLVLDKKNEHTFTSKPRF
jgi:hypothetical protein